MAKQKQNRSKNIVLPICPAHWFKISRTFAVFYLFGLLIWASAFAVTVSDHGFSGALFIPASNSSADFPQQALLASEIGGNRDLPGPDSEVPGVISLRGGNSQSAPGEGDRGGLASLLALFHFHHSAPGLVDDGRQHFAVQCFLTDSLPVRAGPRLI